MAGEAVCEGMGLRRLRKRLARLEEEPVRQSVETGGEQVGISGWNVGGTGLGAGLWCCVWLNLPPVRGERRRLRAPIAVVWTEVSGGG